MSCIESNGRYGSVQISQPEQSGKLSVPLCWAALRPGDTRQLTRLIYVGFQQKNKTELCSLNMLTFLAYNFAVDHYNLVYFVCRATANFGKTTKQIKLTSASGNLKQSKPTKCNVLHCNRGGLDVTCWWVVAVITCPVLWSLVVPRWSASVTGHFLVSEH